MTSYKIFIGDEIRRFRLDNLSYESFVEKLMQTIPNYHPEMKIQYEDSDNDRIVISSETEWREMISHLSGIIKDGVIKLWIDDTKSKQYFKDGSVELIRAYSEKDKQEAVEVNESLTQTAINALSHLFPNKVILPYNIPSYLNDVIDVKCIRDNVAEVDIKISDLFGHLNKVALKLMDSVEEYSLTKAQLILESLLILQPNNPNVYYNMACIESLRKNVEGSFSFLQQAIKSGYNDIQHLCNDPDLSFLRNTEQWFSFLKSVKHPEPENKINVPNNSIPEEPKKVVEPAKIEVPKIKVPKFEVPKIEVPKIEVPKIEVPKIEEPVKNDYTNQKWGKEMQTLSEMGFDLTQSTIIPILDHNKGDIDRTLTDLL